MRINEYREFRSRNERLLQSIRLSANTAKQFYNQSHYLSFFREEILTPSGLFFEVVNYLKSYFFSNLPEATCENVNFKSPFSDQIVYVIQTIANEISYSHKLFDVVDRAILNTLLTGVGIVFFEPTFDENGTLVRISPESVDIRDVTFDPFLPLEENPLVTVDKIVSIASLIERFGEDTVKRAGIDVNSVKTKINFFYDLEEGRLVITPNHSDKILDEREFDRNLSRFLFNALYYATPSGLFLHQREDSPPFPFPSLFLTIEPELVTYARLFIRFVRLLYSVRSLGLIDNSFSEFLNALELAEEGKLVPVNLQAYFNQLNGAPPVFFLPTEDVTRALDTVKAALDAIEAKIKERVGMIDVLETTKVTAENIIRITPFLVDARYANFIKRLDYFIARLYASYTSLKILSSPDEVLLSYTSLSPEASIQEIMSFLTELRASAFRLDASALVIETDSLSQQRQAKRALEMQKVIETVISGISQVVNSVAANPQVAYGIANALVDLIDVYRIGKKYKENIRSGLLTIVQNTPINQQQVDPLVQAEQIKANVKLQELQLRAKELELKASKLQADYQLRSQELAAMQSKMNLDEQIKQIELMLRERDMQISEFEAELKSRKQASEEEKAALMLTIEMQKLELEKLKAQVEAINKMADNIRLEQENKIRTYLSDIQSQLITKFTNTLPQINLNVPVPNRKVVRFAEDPATGEIMADIENKFEPDE